MVDFDDIMVEGIDIILSQWIKGTGLSYIMEKGLEYKRNRPKGVNYRLYIACKEGKGSMTFWSYDDLEIVTFWDRKADACWKATPKDKSQEPLARSIRYDYDNLEFDSSRISFEYDGEARDAAEKFVNEAYPEHWLSLASGSAYEIKDYDVDEWKVIKVGKKGDAVLGWFKPIFTPADIKKTHLWAGNAGMATGKHEGKMTCYWEFVLQKQKDGLWHCIGPGTGGYMLPEDEQPAP